MMRAFWCGMLAMATLAPSLARAGATGADAPAPLRPVGQWLVEGQNNMCALSHGFGDGRDRVTLGIRPYPIADIADVLLFSHTDGDDVRDGKATVQVDDGVVSQPADYVSYALTKGDQRLLSFRVPSAALNGLASSTRLTLALDRRRRVVVSSTGFARGLAALEQCQALLRKQLGIDAAEQARVATPAHANGSPSLWFSYRDYPDEAVHGGTQGVSRLLLTIGVDGRIGRCVTFGSSGNAAMDKTACRKFVERGRYTPALDAAGKPVASFEETSVHWRLGG